MSKVFVLNVDKHPLNPIHPGRARILLRCDGYAYHSQKGGGIPPTAEPVGILP